MYKLVLERNSENVEAMKNLGRLYHQEDTSQENQDRAIGYLERAVALGKHMVVGSKRCIPRN
jgi:TPR repeat protein